MVEAAAQLDQRHAAADPYPSRRGAAPHVIPRRDPVVWSAAGASGPLDPSALVHYAEHGFLVMPQLFDPDEVAALRRAADSARTGTDIDRDTVIEEPGSRAIRSIFEIHRQNDLIGRLARDPRLAAVARFVLGGPVYMHQSRLNYKPGFAGREFWWHSDFETWHVEDGMPRMRALSMSIMLTDNVVANAPLLLITGSHQHFVACVGETPADHFKASLKRQEYGVPDHDSVARLGVRGIEAALGRAGTVVMFDCNVLHGSGSNISPLPRSNLFFVYNSMENRCVAPFSGQPARPQHIANRQHIEPL